MSQQRHMAHASDPVNEINSPHKPQTPTALAEEPHQVEQEVRRRLVGHPELRFSSLVVHRVRNGVCLEGVLEADANTPDICRLAKAVAGVEEVLNHLVVRQSGGIPRKG